MSAVHFADRLADAVRKKRSVVCVGLDPRPEPVIELLDKAGFETDQGLSAAFFTFSMRIVDAVAEMAVAVKPNIAFFEALGPAGVQSYHQVCRYAESKQLLVVGDIKRGDIGSTAAAYATGHLGKRASEDATAAPTRFRHDAVTVNAYLGGDGVEPFVETAAKNGAGLFCLVRTSNPSGAELQDLDLAAGGTVATAMAGLVDTWGAPHVGECGYSLVGAVVGATHGGELADYRARMPKTPFLLPGYGAQGAGADDVTDAFDGQCLGAVVNASRSVIFAGSNAEEDFASAAGEAARTMRDEINAALEASGRRYA